MQVVDFWHAAEYLGKAAAVIYRSQSATRKAWMDENCHKLKHEPGGATADLEAVEVVGEGSPLGQGGRGCATGEITYFTNQSKSGRMDYAMRVIRKEPDRQRCDGKRPAR